ncbi:hypothetical protein Tco_0662550 [Tanacetum coccineum]
MSTPVFVDLESSTQADGAQSSRVPVPLPNDPYVAVRQARLVDTESEPDDAPSKTKETDSSHLSASSDSTAPLSPNHPLTRTSPTPTPTRALFHCRMARITVRAQPIMSPGHSARVTEAMALLDSAFRKRYRSSYETPSPSPSPSPSLTLPVRKRYRGTSELILGIDSKEDEIGGEDIDEDEGDESLDTDDEREGLDDDDRGLDDDDCGLDDEDHGLDDEGHRVESDELGLKKEEEEVVPDGQQREAPVVETAASEPLRLRYEALRCRELAAKEDQVRSTFEVGQGSGSISEPERQERVSALRQPTLTTWTDPEDGRTYIDIPTYPPPAPPVQIPPSPEWSSGSLHVSPTPSAFPSPVSSPMISLIIPSPIASPVATPTATILDHTQRLDSMPPTLFAEIGRDMSELYTRSGAVRDEIFSQRYRLRSLEHEQERTAVTFRVLWRPVLALEAWTEHVDTLMTGMSWAGYDDHRLIHDMLVQQTALQHEL